LTSRGAIRLQEGHARDNEAVHGNTRKKTASDAEMICSCGDRRSSTRGKSSVRTSSLAQGATAAFGAGMKLLDNSAQARICPTRILRIRGVHQLVAVMVHLYSAARAHHFVMVGHNRHLPS